MSPIADRRPPSPGVRVAHRIALVAALLALGACAELMPLREPPLDPTQDYMAVTTRDEAVRAFGPPHEVRSSDLGPVLVYRRAVVVDVNPNRYYGEDRGIRLNQYERLLLYVDEEGNIVRRAIEPE
jgi:hypothetical protein